MSTTTTYHRPLYIPTRWILIVLVSILAVIAIELAVSAAQHSSAQLKPADTRSAPLPASMSGDLLRSVSA